MANLIITVIAIALVAVASLMGAYYGGSAFLNNQSAANASTVLNQGQQLAGAWQAYLSDNVNTVPSGGLNGPTNSLVANNYIASVPVNPEGAGGIAAQNAYVTQAGTTSNYYMVADMGKPGTGGASVTDSNAAACLRIQKTALGTTPTSFTAATIANIPAAGNGTFGCEPSTAVASGGITGSGATPPAAGHYIAVYKIQ